jgi:hypothetical protein
MEQAVATTRTLGCGSLSITSRTSSIFSSEIVDGLPERSRSSTVPVSQNRSNVA